MARRVYDSALWRRLRLEVMQRDGWVCQIDDCGAPATDVDHIVPLVDGGAAYELSNLRAACKPCNGRRARSPLKALAPARPSRDWYQP